MSFPKFLIWCFVGLLILLSSSCHSNHQQKDYPAYHNPFVQPLTTALQQDPHNSQLLFRRSGALRQVGASELAEKDLLKAIELDSSNLNYLYALAQVNLTTNKDSLAVIHLHRLLKKAPTADNAKLLLAKAYLQNGQDTKATKTVQGILAKDSTFPGALYTAANIKLAQKDTTKAIAILNKAIHLRIGNYPASLLLAKCLAAQHNPKAIDLFRETFKMDTTDVTPLVQLGTYYEQEQKPNTAEDIYKKVLLKDHEATPAIINLGKIYLNKDSFPKALRHFKMAIQTQPNSAKAYYYKGLAFEYLHQTDSAIIAYKQALVFAPKWKNLHKALKGLKKQKN